MRQSQKSRLLFSSAEMFKKPLWQTVWTEIRGAVCSGSALFASILESSVMLGNYLKQTTFSDALFYLAALRVKLLSRIDIHDINTRVTVESYTTFDHMYDIQTSI